jgi:hypothetical protein
MKRHSSPGAVFFWIPPMDDWSYVKTGSIAAPAPVRSPRPHPSLGITAFEAVSTWRNMAIARCGRRLFVEVADRFITYRGVLPVCCLSRGALHYGHRIHLESAQASRFRKMGFIGKPNRLVSYADFTIHENLLILLEDYMSRCRYVT